MIEGQIRNAIDRSVAYNETVELVLDAQLEDVTVAIECVVEVDDEWDYGTIPNGIVAWSDCHNLDQWQLRITLKGEDDE